MSADYADLLTNVALRPRRSRGSVARSILAPMVGVVGFLALWQFLVWVFDIKQFELPTPTEILRHLWSDPSFYFENARATLWEASLGFLLGLVGALIGATIMAHNRFIEQAVLPVAVLIQVTPIIAYAPAVVIWLHFGIKPILFITSLVCFVPFLFNAVTGFRSIEPAAHELLRSVNASKREVFFRLRVPSALPYLFSAARIAVGLALIGAVLGEFFAGVSSGLGFAVKTAQNRNLALQLWGSIYVLAFLGAVAITFISMAERMALRWHSSQTTTA
jgi:NitT/TauT family transport system permease protein